MTDAAVGKARVRVVVSGRVQGVAFRQATRSTTLPATRP